MELSGGVYLSRTNLHSANTNGNAEKSACRAMANSPICLADSNTEALTTRNNMARIVLVEPSRRDFTALRRFLHTSGHQCDLHFKLARQALTHLKVGDCELLIVTLELPDIHGLELVTMLRRGGQLKSSTPVLVCSSLGSSLNIHHAIRTGVSGFLRADDRLSLIGRAVDAVLAGGTIFPEHRRVPVGANPRLDSALVFPTHLIAVLHGLRRGCSVASLAEHLSLSGASIGQHKRQLMRKLSANSLDDLFRISEEIGLL